MKRVFIIALCFFLGSCATTSDHTSTTKSERNRLWNQLQSKNSQISGWNLKGKIGVKSGRKGGSATLKWSNITNHQNIELYGPFGGGRVRIETTDRSAVLKDSKGRVIKGETAQEVLFKRMGWHVPFDELLMWSRGLPDKQATDIVTDEFGRLMSMNQGIWHVEYLEYRSAHEFTLPRKITISSLPNKIEVYDDDNNYLGDELIVKVIFSRWLSIDSG